MKLVVVGTGYVGLVTGACFADIGHDVVCVDKDRPKIEALQRGKIPIFEPDLEGIVEANTAVGRLLFSTELGRATADADAVFIAVGTPARDYDGYTDRSFVFAAAREIAPALSSGAIAVVKSTVPVGTGDELEIMIGEMRPGDRIPVISNPEFLRAGSAVADFMQPDRIVIGADDSRARAIMECIYRSMPGKPALLFTSRRSSELIKYGANVLLATKIAFINEMADLCECTQADIQEVAKGIGLDRRIGPRFLQAGPGFGGSCFRKDALALVKMGEDHQTIMRITEAMVASNESRKRMLLRKVATAVGGSIRDKAVAVWGITFKPNTDDVRESPAIPLIAALLEAGADVRLYDPEGLKAAQSMWPGRIKTSPDACSAAHNAHVLVVMTEWEEFRNVELSKLHKLMLSPNIVDMRNIFSPDQLAELGFTYHSIGRAPRETSRAVVHHSNGHRKNGNFGVTGPRRKGKEQLAPAAVT